MALLGSVDISFTKSTKIAVDATDTAGQASTVAHQATDAAGQAQATAQTASQTATQAAATAADAAQAAQTAITTANGKNKAYYGATTPTSPQSGDIWFVEDSSGNVTAIKHYDGTQWVTDVDNTALAQQISAAQAAADNAATVGQAAQQVAQQAAQVGDSAAKTAAAAKQAANAAQTDAANAVSKNDVINQINVSTEGILIDGRKVHITGQTTIDNAVIKDAMIDSISANKLTAGTIDANVITVTNINASNIVTGTLDASKATVTNIDASKITTGTLNAARIAAGSIDASKLNVTSLSAISANLGTVTAGSISGISMNIGNGNFTVDTAGNLVARNANITGVINATSGSFSGTLEGATGTFKGSISTPFLTVQADRIEQYSKFGLQLQTAQWQASDTQPYVNNGFIVFNTENTGLEIYHTDLNGKQDTLQGVTVNALNFVVYGDVYGNTMQVNNIVLNGKHSIISKDGGQLYFTDDGGKRIDITVNQVYADKWIMPNNMQIGYHTIQTNDNGDLWFNGSNGSRIDIHVGTLYYAGSLSKSSSEAIKANIMPMNFSALDEIMKTDFYSYNYKTDLEKGITKPSYGVVIGDKYHLSDKFLTQDEKAVSIDNMTAINSQAIKELYGDMQKQNQQIVLKMADLEARLAKLEAKYGDSSTGILPANYCRFKKSNCHAGRPKSYTSSIGNLSTKGNPKIGRKIKGGDREKRSNGKGIGGREGKSRGPRTHKRRK